MSDLARELAFATSKPTIRIHGEDGRTLLTLDRRGGCLVAEYDPADLDEAAQIFVREVVRIAGMLNE